MASKYAVPRITDTVLEFLAAKHYKQILKRTFLASPLLRTYEFHPKTSTWPSVWAMRWSFKFNPWFYPFSQRILLFHLLLLLLIMPLLVHLLLLLLPLLLLLLLLLVIFLLLLLLLSLIYCSYCVLLQQAALRSPLRSFCCRLVNNGAGRLRLQVLLIQPDPTLGARPIDHCWWREYNHTLQPMAAAKGV